MCDYLIVTNMINSTIKRPLNKNTLLLYVYYLYCIFFNIHGQSNFMAKINF